MHTAQIERQWIVDRRFGQTIDAAAHRHRLTAGTDRRQFTRAGTVRAIAQIDRAALRTGRTGIDRHRQAAVTATRRDQPTDRTRHAGITRRCRTHAQALREAIRSRSVQYRKRLPRRITHVHIAKRHWVRRRRSLCQAVHGTRDIHDLVGQRDIVGEAAGTGTVRLSTDRHRSRLHTHAARVDADHDAAVRATRIDQTGHRTTHGRITRRHAARHRQLLRVAVVRRRVRHRHRRLRRVAHTEVAQVHRVRCHVHLRQTIHRAGDLHGI